MTSRGLKVETDWEDLYRRKNDEHEEFKRDRKVVEREMEEHNRQLQRDIRKLKKDGAELGAAPVPAGLTKDDEQQVSKLYAENVKLKSVNAAIKEKYKALAEALEKKKRENIMLQKKLKASSGSTAPLLPPPGRGTSALQEIDIKPAPTSLKGTSNSSNLAPVRAAEALPEVENAAGYLQVARNLKIKLEAAKEQIEQQRVELERARSAAAGSKHSAGGADGNAHDNYLRLQQLQTQYEILVSQTASKGQVYKNMEEQIEESAAKIRDLRRALEELRHEKEQVDIKAERADELEHATSELRRANRSLEDKIARLCEAPFINDAFGQQESRLRFEDVAKEREEYLAKVNHLQEAVRTHYSALTSLKQHAAQLREEKEAAEKRAEDMKLKMQEAEAGSSMFQDKLKMYSGDGDVDIDALERALTLVKRRGEAIGKLPFLEDPDGDSTLTVPLLKRKLEEVQIMNLKLTEEVERFESMLKLQSGINRDLHKELEVVVHKRDGDKKVHAKRADEAEALAKRRQAKVEALEAQVRQLLYDVNKHPSSKGRGGQMAAKDPSKQKAGASEDDHAFDGSTVASDAGNALLNQLLDEGGGELSPDVNLLEVWVKSANIVGNSVPSGASTMAIVEFFDFNSQPTSLERGSKPKWDFATTYKLTLDDFLIRYLATDVCTIELHAVAQGDNALLARCSVPLSALLNSKPAIILRQHPMISVKTGEILAYLEVELRLALPVSELYRLFLERHPNEKHFLKERARHMQIEATSATDRAQRATSDIAAAQKEDESRLYNDLEISIIKATGLPLSKNGKSPTAYVHFQFLMFPDVITPAIPGTQDPVFNLRWSFAMITNEDKLRLLRRSTLHITILDMNGEEMSDDDSEGLVGEVFIKLDQLSDGISFQDSFAVKDAEGRKVADLEVGMRWKHTFRQMRDLGPRALSAVDVEMLISAFSADETSAGTVVDYRAFCRFVDPPVEVRRVMDRLRNYAQRISESEGRSSRDVFKVLFEENMDIDPDSFLNKMELTNLDVLPSDYARLFAFIDMDENNLITLEQILTVLNLDETVLVPQGLNEKLRERSRDMSSRGLTTMGLFEMADQWGVNGLVTRMEFKQVLRKMGFELVDEGSREAEIIDSKLADNGRGQLLDADGRNDDVLNDTLGSNDDVLIPAGGDIQDASRGSVLGRYAGEDAKMQRAIFDQRTQAAAVSRGKALELAATQVKNATGAPVKVEGRNLLSVSGGPAASRPMTAAQQAADSFTADSGKHHAGVTTAGSRVPSRPIDLDAAQVAQGATTVQKVVRGHQARSDLSVSLPVADAAGGAGLSAVPGNPEKSAVDILNAEATIRACLAELRGVAPEPNFLAGFERVDTKRTGFVSRTQFAHVMKQFDVIKLQGSELRACMDFFDASAAKDGSQINYEAFAALIRHREPNMLQGVQRVYAMILGPDAASKMRAYDGTGNGHIKRADMMRALAALGFEHLGAAATLSMLELFETKEEGQVNYTNFVECVRELPLSRELDRAAAEIFQRVANMTVSGYASNPRAQVDEAVARAVFENIDVQHRGKFSKAQLAHYLSEQEIRVSASVVAPLLSQMDNSGRGEVSLHDFVSWVKNLPHAVRLGGSMYATPSLLEIQKKGHAFMLAVAKSAAAGASSPSLEEIGNCFSVYDWTHPPVGAIGRGLFMHACKAAGFCFSTGELRTLATEFATADNSGRVRFRKFLEWATPDSNAGSLVLSKTDGGKAAARPEHGHPATTLIRFLEKKLQSGTDLLSIFGRYDKLGAGRITADECCAAFADLGISTVSQKEALEMADRYSAAVSGFVMYRRVVQDLLRHLDDVTNAGSIDVVDAVRAAMQRSRVELRRLRDIFELYDKRSTGKVDEVDLGIIFEEARVQMKRKELEAIGDKYCVSGGTHGTNLVSYGPLLAALEQRLGETGTTGAGHAVAAVGAEFANKMRGVFEELISRGKDFYAELSRHDDYTGTMPQGAFREVMLDRLRTQLSARDLETLEKAYREPGNARVINYSRLLHDFHPRYFSQGVPRSGENAYTHAEALRNKIRRRCDYITPGQLRKLFPTFKRRRESYGVSLADLAAAMRGLQMVVASDHEREIFEMINLSNGQEFSYVDFCVFVKDPFHQDVVWKLHKLMNKNRVGEPEITKELAKYDPHSTGVVAVADFERALKHCNVELAATDVSRLIVRFDVEEAQRVDLKLFSQFLKGQTAVLPEGALAARDEREGESSAWSALRQRIIDKLEVGFTENEVFAIFDPERRGVLDLAGLTAGSRDIGAELARTEARAVMRRMMQLVSGDLDRTSFYEAFQIDIKVDVKRRDREVDRREDRRDSARDSARDRDVPKADSGAAASDGGIGIYDAIREKVMRSTDVKDRVTTPEEFLRKALERSALEKNGRLSQRELNAALDALGCPPTKRELLKIEQALDPDFNNYIPVTALVDAVFPGAGSRVSARGSAAASNDRAKPARAASIFTRRPDLVSELMKTLVDRRRVDDLLGEFVKADRHSTGMLERGEFAKALGYGGVRLDRGVERDLVDTFGENSAGIDYRDFVEACVAELNKESVIDDVILRLQKHIAADSARGHTINDEFRAMDRNDDGELDIEEIERALGKIGLPLSRDESKRIVQRFSTNGTSIKYRVFVKALTPGGDHKDAGNVVELLLDRIKRKLEDRLGSKANVARELKEAFADIDKNNDGTLDASEFRSAMRVLRVELERDDVSIIFKRYADGDKMNYDDFLRLVDFSGTNGGSGSARRDDRAAAGAGASRRPKATLRDVEKIADEVRRRLEDYLGTGSGVASRIKSAFSDIDRDNSGDVDKKEFSTAMKSLRADVSADDVDALFDYYDGNSSRGLDYGEFIRLLGFDNRDSARGSARRGEEKMR